MNKIIVILLAVIICLLLILFRYNIQVIIFIDSKGEKQGNYKVALQNGNCVMALNHISSARLTAISDSKKLPDN